MSRRRKLKVPGSIYLNGSRWWWDVRLPCETKRTQIPLKPEGARYATKDRATAKEVAEQMWHQAIFKAKADERPPDTSTIAGLARAYQEHAREYYGEDAGELDRIRWALKPLIEHCPQLPPEEFGPLKFQEVRDRMVDAGLARSTVNQRAGTIKRMFKWATSRELVPGSVFHALQAVPGLRAGRTKAGEPREVKPIDETWVRKTLPYLPPAVAAMVEVQFYTGMRSSELCSLRGVDLDTRGRIWYYRPQKHKTGRLGHERVVAIGPKAQRVLKEYLKPDLGAYLFSPAESEDRRRAEEHSRRRTPMNQGNKPGSNRVESPKRKPRERYDKNTYYRAVKRGIERANETIRKRLEKQGLKGKDLDRALQQEPIPDWHPHQLRHTAATRIRREMGIDAARAALGHKHLRITETYAELDKGLASEAARRLG